MSTRFNSVFVTATGAHLPGAPVDNDNLDRFIAPLNASSSRIKRRILAENGIRSRHYAIAEDGSTIESAASMAASAVRVCLADSEVPLADVNVLCTGTSGGDVGMPASAADGTRTMSIEADFLTEPHDPRDPNPWLAIYLDQSIPIADECKKAWLADSSSRSRQFLLPIVRPLARSAIVLFQLLRIAIPNAFTSSRILHRLLEWNMRTWVSRNANTLIFRHFYLGSEILQFIATNTRGVKLQTTPLKPTKLAEIREHVYLQHDLNLYNFVIEINRQLRALNLELAPTEELNFDCITDGGLPIEPMPDRWTNFIDLETAVELYTPVYQLFLTDNDFWRTSTLLQLDETIGVYVSKLLGTPWTTALINNKHPMVPLSTLRAGFRLILHGLATETQHAIVSRLCAPRRLEAKGRAVQE